MKIQFPNPQDYLGREDLFFDQLELCVFHAKKAWTKVRSQERYKDVNQYPWLSFQFPKEIEKAIENVDPDREECQEISLCIEEL